MQAVFSWFTSQSGASLLVALIALGGVLSTTGWNNWALEKRRKADDDRRERERQEIRWREDSARQRGAVIKCVRSIRDAEITFQKVVMEKVFADPYKVSHDDLAQYVLETFKATSFADFYRVCISAAEELELEVTQPNVREQAVRLRKKIESEYNEFDGETKKGLSSWIDWSNKHKALSVDVQNCLNNLVTSAFEHLHPFPTPDGAVPL
ncbi:MAG: hypothetical protein HLX46_12025 [Corynebacterium sp.]|uniref:hypothetical protein n=1 Tax=Corynebacterium sp. TaxID=1720 RepID=UPI0017A0BB15|nr:hypothetical protein [Corynebacterium sp.]NWO17526.1 hypothetical protein [Corynebacterium sp.]